MLAGIGWQREDVKLVQQMASNGAEPIGSLGYDGPLGGALARAPEPGRLLQGDGGRRHQPGDRPRARDRALLLPRGVRRAARRDGPAGHEPQTIETAFPIILGGHDDMAPLSDEVYRRVAKEHKTYLLEDLWELLPAAAARCSTSRALESETTQGALERLKYEAIDDGARRRRAARAVGPHRLRRRAPLHRPAPGAGGDRPGAPRGRVEPNEPNLRRRTAIVLRSGAIRNVHDVVLALGLGADGVCPYVMIEVLCVDDYEQRHRQPLLGAAQGHREGDLDDRHPRGARLRAAVLVDRPEARARRDLRHARLLRLGRGRHRLRGARRRRRPSASASSPARRRTKPAKTFRFYPKVYKAAIAAANGTSTLRGVLGEGARAGARAADLDAPHPRPALRPRADRPGAGRPGVGHHSYPIVIASMSFGSQGEMAYRAYAEAASGSTSSAINGEGGEIRDMYGKYPQVARPAGRLGPLRRDLRDAQLVLPRRDQDRPGREARRGRPPARPRRSPRRWRSA